MSDKWICMDSYFQRKDLISTFIYFIYIRGRKHSHENKENLLLGKLMSWRLIALHMLSKL